MGYQIVNVSGGWIMPAPKITREHILRLQDSLLTMQQESGQEFKERGNTDDLCPLVHRFAPGLYAREIFIPAGTVIVGKIHRHAHVNTISKGSAVVATEFGLQTLTAPHTFVSLPGTKRAVLAVEDVVWTTYHPTTETDIDKIEDEIIAPTFSDFEQGRLQ